MSIHQFNSSPPLPSMSDSSSGRQVEYTFNSKIMVAAMVILFVVVLFVVSLHVYAKWFWRQGTMASRWSTTSALNASWRRRRRRLDIVTDESVVANACIGLDASTVNSLPTFIYEGAMHEAEPLLECAVCLSEFQVHDKGRFLPNCKHSFHIDCIDMWFHSHSTCPLCRTPVSVPMTHEQRTGHMSNPLPPFLQRSVSSSTMHERHEDEQNTSAALRICPPNSPLQNAGMSPMALADRREPLPLLQGMARLDPQQEDGLANNAGMGSTLCTHIPSASASCGHIPSYGELFGRDDISHASLPRMGASGSSSTQLPTTETSRRRERAEIARSTSLISVSRSLSEDMQACSMQTQKSSSFRMTIKWLLSKELSKGRSRVFPSGQANAESEQNTSNMNLPV